MEIILNETSATESLAIIDPRTGLDYTADFIGNTGAMTDGQFRWDAERDAWICDQSTYDWWSAVIAEHAAVDERIYRLQQEHGQAAVNEIVWAVGSVDLDMQPAALHEALDEVFGVVSP